MTPYVIDKQKQLTIYLLFVLGIIISFGLGFVFGFKIANPGSMLDSLPAIEQPAEAEQPVEENTTDETDDSKKKPDETIDKKSQEEKASDQKKTVSQTNKPKAVETKKTASSQTQQKKEIKSTAAKPVATPQKTPVTVSQPVKTVEKPVVKVAQITSPPAANPVSVEAVKEKQNTETDNTEKTTADNTDKKKPHYSVQAGLFASRDNAVTFLDELLSNGFDAYLLDFVSSSGDVKYNVRFGRSDDRDVTKKRLEEFRQAFNTPAYIVIGN